MKQIKQLTFDKACKTVGLDSKKVIASLKKSFDFLDKKEAGAHRAHAMCAIMVRAANKLANGGKDWTPDFTDNSWKYEAWWSHRGGSSGFRYLVCDGWDSGSTVGSRLCFISAEACRALCQDNKEYIKLWNEYAL